MLLFCCNLREFCHSLAACWVSSWSHRCCCWQRSAWPSPRWPPAGSGCGLGSRRSQRGRAWGRPCRSTPGRSSHSRWIGSSKGSKEGLDSADTKSKRQRSKHKQIFLFFCSSSTNVFPLTVGITYPQFSWIPWILYYTDSLDFPHFSFSDTHKHTNSFSVVLNRANNQYLTGHFHKVPAHSDSQYFRADHSNRAVCCQSEIGLDAAALLKLGRQLGNFKPSPHELWGSGTHGFRGNLERCERRLWINRNTVMGLQKRTTG